MTLLIQLKHLLVSLFAVISAVSEVQTTVVKGYEKSIVIPIILEEVYHLDLYLCYLCSLWSNGLWLIVVDLHRIICVICT